jgi:hypothetical protein
MDEGDPVWALQAITGKAASDANINPNNIASAWNAGQLVILCTGSSTADARIVSGHAYAVVGYDGAGNFHIFNPWGTDANGWVPGRVNQTYGLFWFSAAAVTQNYALQSIGTGAAAQLASIAPLDDGHSPLEAGAAQAGNAFFLTSSRTNTDAEFAAIQAASAVFSQNGFAIEPTLDQPVFLDHGNADLFQSGLAVDLTPNHVEDDCQASGHFPMPDEVFAAVRLVRDEASDPSERPTAANPGGPNQAS